MNQQTTPSAVIPSASGHSVINAVFICEFASTVTVDDLNIIRSVYDSSPDLQSALPVQQLHRGATFTINAADGNINAQAASDAPVGVSYLRIAANGQPEWQVKIDSNRIVVIAGSYSRWAKIFESVQKFLNLFVSPLSDKIISSLALQYTDAFEVFPGEGKSIASAIFLPNNDFLNNVSLSSVGSWHAHSGWFEDLDGSLKSLINLNVDTAPASNVGFWKVAITHMQKVSFTKKVNSKDLNLEVYPLFSELHTRNKKMLERILLQEVCNMISLNSTAA